MVNTGLERNDFSRLEKGWEMVRRNVGRVRNMVMDILYYAKDREPQYRKFPAVEVYDAGEIEADYKALRALLVNVLENSLDACRMDSSNENPRVSFSVRGREDEVIFEISDNGIGMDTETREKLFTLFFSSKGVEGTGLGMFVANQIAKQHGGCIEVESEPGEGARFYIVLPRDRESSAPNAG